MIEQLLNIAKRIELHCDSKIPTNPQYVVCSTVIYYLEQLIDRKVTENIYEIINELLLKTCCELNLVDEARDIFELFPQKINKVISLQTLNVIVKGGETTRYLSSQNKTLLGIAAFNGHFNMVEFLVDDQNALVNARDHFGDTALHQVVYGDSSRYISDLKPNDKSKGHDHIKVAEFLIRRGAELSIQNKQDKTPVKCLITYPSNGGFLYLFSAQGNSYKLQKLLESTLEKGSARERLECAILHYLQRNELMSGYQELDDIPKAMQQLKKKDLELIEVVLNDYNENNLENDNVSKTATVVTSSCCGFAIHLLGLSIMDKLMCSIPSGVLSGYFSYRLLNSFSLENRIARPVDAKDANLPPEEWCKARAQDLLKLQALEGEKKRSTRKSKSI